MTFPQWLRALYQDIEWRSPVERRSLIRGLSKMNVETLRYFYTEKFPPTIVAMLGRDVDEMNSLAA